MKNVFMYALLFGLFIVTTAETCDDCDQVCLDQLEDCALETQSLEFQNQTLNTNIDFVAASGIERQRGILCPPPCKGPNPCDICSGCNIANCLFYVEANFASNALIEIYDANQTLVATSEEGQPTFLNDSYAYLNIETLGEFFPTQGMGTIVVDEGNGEIITREFNFEAGQ